MANEKQPKGKQVYNFHINSVNRVEFTVFEPSKEKQEKRFDVRIYFQDVVSGEWYPTKRGMRMFGSLSSEFEEGIQAVKKELGIKTTPVKEEKKENKGKKK